MANKFYTVEKEIGGVKYTAQFNGISAALRAVDSTYVDGTENTSLEKMSDYVLKNVIVEPKGLSIDDFDSMKDLQEVVAWGQEVMQGNFRPEPDKKATKTESK